jgi:hypothetical protein
MAETTRDQEWSQIIISSPETFCFFSESEGCELGGKGVD